MPHILIIEDEPGVQITLEDRLVAEGYEITIEGDGITGESRAKNNYFDLILLDVMLPGRDGFAVCQNLRKHGIHSPILMLTARNTNLDTIMGLRTGADDYLAKPFDMGLLLARIEALLRRAKLNPIEQKNKNSSTITFGDFTLDKEKGILLMGEKTIELHAKEFTLLYFLCSNEGTMLNRNKILDEVWGYTNETTTRTVDVHIAKLRQKLGESERPHHIQTYRGLGYKFILD